MSFSKQTIQMFIKITWTMHTRDSPNAMGIGMMDTYCIRCRKTSDFCCWRRYSCSRYIAHSARFSLSNLPLEQFSLEISRKLVEFLDIEEILFSKYFWITPFLIRRYYIIKHTYEETLCEKRGDTYVFNWFCFRTKIWFCEREREKCIPTWKQSTKKNNDFKNTLLPVR